MTGPGQERFVDSALWAGRQRQDPARFLDYPESRCDPIEIRMCRTE